MVVRLLVPVRREYFKLLAKEFERRTFCFKALCLSGKLTGAFVQFTYCKVSCGTRFYRLSKVCSAAHSVKQRL